MLYSEKMTYIAYVFDKATWCVQGSFVWLTYPGEEDHVRHKSRDCQQGIFLSRAAVTNFRRRRNGGGQL